MKRILFFLVICSCLAAVAGIAAFNTSKNQPGEERFISYQIDPEKQQLKLYWKDDQQQIFGSILRLQSWLASHRQRLVFGMNGGMYKTDQSPLGLFIENGKQHAPLNSRHAGGNFYLQPNGVFFLTDKNLPVICTTQTFSNSGNIKYATQSGPMLVTNGDINPAFTPDSKNLNIRNGAGILSGNKVVFAMSKVPVSFYEFAAYFKNLGCKNALYFDGFVSRTYLPEQNCLQTDGAFGVMVGVTEPAN